MIIRALIRIVSYVLIVTAMLSCVNAAQFFDMTTPGASDPSNLIHDLDCVNVDADDVKFISYVPKGKFDNMYPRLIIQTRDMMHEVEFIDGQCHSRSEYVDWERAWSSSKGLDTFYEPNGLEGHPEFFVPHATPAMMATEGSQVYSMYAAPVYCQSGWSREMDGNDPLCTQARTYDSSWSIGDGPRGGECCGEPEDIFETYEAPSGVCFEGNWIPSTGGMNYLVDTFLPTAKNKMFEVIINQSSQDKLLSCGVKNDAPLECSCDETKNPGCCEDILNLTRRQKPYQGQSNMLNRSNFDTDSYSPWQISGERDAAISDIDNSLQIDVGSSNVTVIHNLTNLMAGRIYNYHVKVRGDDTGTNASLGNKVDLFYRIMKDDLVVLEKHEDVEILNHKYQPIYLLFGVPPYIDWTSGTYADNQGTGELLGNPPISLSSADATAGIEIDGESYFLAVQGTQIYLANMSSGTMEWYPGGSSVSLPGNIKALAIYNDPYTDMQHLLALSADGNTIHGTSFDGFSQWPQLKDHITFTDTLTSNIQGGSGISWGSVDMMECISGDRIYWILMDDNDYYVSDFTRWFELHKNDYDLFEHDFKTGSMSKFYDLMGENDSTPPWDMVGDGAIVDIGDIPYWFNFDTNEFYSSMFFMDEVKQDGLLGAKWQDSKYHDLARYKHQVGIEIEGSDDYQLFMKEPKVSSNDYLLDLKKGEPHDPLEGDPLLTDHQDYCKLIERDTDHWGHFCSFGEEWVTINSTSRLQYKINVSQSQFGLKYLPYERWLEYKGTENVHEWIRPMGCCLDNECWNGTGCSPPANDEPEPVFLPNRTNEGYLCWSNGTHANWTWMQLDKRYWDNLDIIGSCPNETMCLVDVNGNKSNNGKPHMYSEQERTLSIEEDRGTNNPVCINDSQFIGDHLCEDGNWTTRTESLAEEMLRNVDSTQDFILYCDSYNNLLSVLDVKIGEGLSGSPTVAPGCTPPDNSENLKKYYIVNSFTASEPCRTEAHYRDSPYDDDDIAMDNVNNFCILGWMEGADFRRIIGTSLNQPIDAQNYPFQDLIDRSITGYDPDDHNYISYLLPPGTPGYSVLYNPALQSVIFSSRADISLGATDVEPSVQSIKDWMKKIFWDIGNESLDLHEDAPVELNFSSDYSRIFIAHEGANTRLCNLYYGACNMTVWGGISESATRSLNDIYVDAFLHYYEDPEDLSICRTLSNVDVNFEYNCTSYSDINGTPTIIMEHEARDEHRLYDELWVRMTAGLRLFR